VHIAVSGNLGSEPPLPAFTQLKKQADALSVRFLRTALSISHLPRRSALRPYCRSTRTAQTGPSEYCRALRRSFTRAAIRASCSNLSAQTSVSGTFFAASCRRASSVYVGSAFGLWRNENRSQVVLLLSINVHRALIHLKKNTVQIQDSSPVSPLANRGAGSAELPTSYRQSRLS